MGQYGVWQGSAEAVLEAKNDLITEGFTRVLAVDSLLQNRYIGVYFSTPIALIALDTCAFGADRETGSFRLKRAEAE